MNKTILVVIIILAILGLVGFFVLNQPKEAQAPSHSETAEETTGNNSAPMPVPENSVNQDKPVTETVAAKEFTVTAKSFSYTPNTISVKKGDRVKITLQNIEGFHDIVIDEFQANSGRIGAGQTAVMEFTANQAGTFEFYCSVGNHRAQGMVGKLIVE